MKSWGRKKEAKPGKDETKKEDVTLTGKTETTSRQDQLTITLQPGPLGIAFSKDNGAISKVNDGQCGAQGVQAGWRFETIDGKPYSKILMSEKLKGTTAYEVTVVPQELSSETKGATESLEKKSIEGDRSGATSGGDSSSDDSSGSSSSDVEAEAIQRVENTIEAKNQKAEEQAALRIQAIQRGRQGRQEVAKMKAKVKKLPAAQVVRQSVQGWFQEQKPQSKAAAAARAVSPPRPAASPCTPASASRPQSAPDSEGRGNTPKKREAESPGLKAGDRMYQQHAERLKKQEEKIKRAEAEEVREANKLASRGAPQKAAGDLEKADNRRYNEAQLKEQRLEQLRKDHERLEEESMKPDKTYASHPLNQSEPPEILAKTRYDHLYNQAALKDRKLEEQRKAEARIEERELRENNVHAKSAASTPGSNTDGRFDRLYNDHSAKLVKLEDKIQQEQFDKAREAEDLAARTVQKAAPHEVQEAGSRMFREAEQKNQRMEDRRKDHDEKIDAAAKTPRKKKAAPSPPRAGSTPPRTVASPSPPRAKPATTPPGTPPRPPAKSASPPRSSAKAAASPLTGNAPAATPSASSKATAAAPSSGNSKVTTAAPSSGNSKATAATPSASSKATAAAPSSGNSKVATAAPSSGNSKAPSAPSSVTSRGRTDAPSSVTSRGPPAGKVTSAKKKSNSPSPRSKNVDATKTAPSSEASPRSKNEAAPRSKQVDTNEVAPTVTAPSSKASPRPKNEASPRSKKIDTNEVAPTVTAPSSKASPRSKKEASPRSKKVDSNEVAPTVEVTLRPGNNDIQYLIVDGGFLVEDVRAGTSAYNSVNPGWLLVKIDGLPLTASLFEEKAFGKKPYAATFLRATE